MSGIDVVVPVYNTAKYLRKCIESILCQEIGGVRIILVDDGSTDGSSEICDAYARKEKCIEVIHQENKGVMQAIWAGVKVTTADYVTIIDSDDWLAKDTFKGIIKYMDSNNDVIVFSITRYFSQENFYRDYVCNFVDRCEVEEIRNMIFPQMLWDIDNKRPGLDPALCNKVYKRSLLLKYVEKAEFLRGNYGQDVAIIYPLMKEVNSIVFSNAGSYYHRQRKKGVIAPYLCNRNFARGLYDLYEYLMNEFEGYENVQRQIDYFYSFSTNLRLRMYGDEIPVRYYIFPFLEIPYGSSIVLYGAGKVGEMYYYQIKKTGFCNLVGWVDEKVRYKNEICVTPPGKLGNLSYKYIVIAIENNVIAKEVCCKLKETGVDEEKIIWSIDCIKL